VSYSSQEDLIERFGESMLIDLTDLSMPATGQIDAAKIARALEDTDATIDGYLSGRYVLPLSQTPPMLRDLSLSIAIYKLHRDTSSDKIQKDYNDALKTLVLVSNGTVRLDVAGVQATTNGSNEVRTNETCRPFTADSLKGFI